MSCFFVFQSKCFNDNTNFMDTAINVFIYLIDVLHLYREYETVVSNMVGRNQADCEGTINHSQLADGYSQTEHR